MQRISDHKNVIKSKNGLNTQILQQKKKNTIKSKGLVGGFGIGRTYRASRKNHVPSVIRFFVDTASSLKIIAGQDNFYQNTCLEKCIPVTRPVFIF